MTTDTVSRETKTEYVAYLDYDEVTWQESYSFTDRQGKHLGVLHENFSVYRYEAEVEPVDDNTVRIDGGFNTGCQITLSGTYDLTTTGEDGEAVVSQETFSSTTTIASKTAAEPAYMPVSDQLLADTGVLWVEMASEGNTHEALWSFQHSLAVSNLVVSVVVVNSTPPQLPDSPSAQRGRNSGRSNI